MPAKPPPLPELQRWLRWALTDPRGPEAALAGRVPAGFALPLRPEPRPRLASWVADGPGPGRARRLEVYADAYFLRLADNLAADFPTLRAALDAGAFRSLCAAFLARHPSRSPLAGQAGAALPAFLAAHPPARRRPLLVDAARLDRAVLEALTTDLAPAPDAAALAAAPASAWPRARLRLDPTARLLDLCWPVEGAWAAVQRGARPDFPRAAAPGSVLVWRDSEWARVRHPEPREAAALAAVLAGRTLAAAYRAAGGGDPAWLAAWLSEGLLKAVDFPP